MAVSDETEKMMDVPHRLDSMTMVVRVAKVVPQLVLAFVAIVASKGLTDLPLMGLLFLPAFILLGGIGAALHWWHFTYRLEADEMRIQRGLLSRHGRSIPYHRIQDVNIEQAFLPRLFGLAEVRLETGSGDGDDATLKYVSFGEAERLRTLLRGLRDHAKGQATSSILADVPGAGGAKAEDDAGDSPPIFAMALPRVLIAGLFNFSLVVFAVIGTVISQLSSFGSLWSAAESFLFRLDLENAIWTLGLASGTMLAVMASVAVAILGLVSGLVTTLLREYGFRLDRTATGFRRRRGLLTLSDMAMPKPRIQAAVILTDPLRQYFGWYVLKFQSLARDSKDESDHMVAPLADRDEILRILAEADIGWSADWAAMTCVSPALHRLSMAIALPLLAVAIFVSAALAGPDFAFLLVALPLVYASSWLRWYRHRYALQDGQINVSQGLWKKRLTILPLAKVQSADLHDSFFLRRFGLAGLRIGVAGGAARSPLSIGPVPIDEARNLQEALVRH